MRVANRGGVKDFFLLALLTLGAPIPVPLAGQDAEGPAVEMRDSAGIRIVENAIPVEGSRLDWQIGPEPSVTIGEVEGEAPYLLHNAFDATRLSGGRIVVANTGSRELRVYDAAGIHLVNWGGRGEGPGEFRGDLRQVERWAGDSIIAWFTDFEQGLSVFDTDGRFGRSFVLEREPTRFPAPRTVHEDGTILATTYAGVDEHVVDIRNGDGTLVSSLGNFPSAEIYEYDRPEGGRGQRWVAYGFHGVTGFWGQLVFIGITNRYEIMALGPDGALARIVRRDHVPRATTPADLDFYVESELSFQRNRHPPPDEESLKSYREVFASTPLAETFPAFSEVVVDAAGYLWVREYDFPGEPRATPLWTVFDEQGRVLGFIETPRELEILEIGEDYVLGRKVDDLGVESIQLWPVDRSGGV